MFSSNYLPKVPQRQFLDKHLFEASLEEITNTFERRNVCVRVWEGFECVEVQGFKDSVTAEELSRIVRAKVTWNSTVVEDLVRKIEDRTNPYRSLGGERLSLECFDPAIPELGKQRLVDAIAHKVFLPLKSRVEDLNPQDQNFYKSFNCYRRQVLFPEGARLGLGIFAHADCMHYLSPNASKKYFVKEYSPVETASSEARIAIPATRKVAAGSAPLFASEGTKTPDLSLSELSMNEPRAVRALPSEEPAEISRKRGAFSKTTAFVPSKTALKKRVAFQQAGEKAGQKLKSIVS